MNEQLTPRETFVQAGEHAPDFVLLDQDRQEWRLSDAVRRGDVALCFFPMAFTGVCGTEMKCISAEVEAWTSKGAQVVGVSCDSFAVLKAWAQSEGFRQTLLADMHRRVCRAYGIYWPELNLSGRGTVVVSRNQRGEQVVKWSQKREIREGMDWEQVLAALS
jgi:peroxiredoxin